MRRPTLKDVAEQAGVHQATASRALNESSRHLVQAETLERVLGVARSLGYTANITARTLRTARSRTIGVLVADITNPIFPPLVRGVESVLGTCGYSALVANTDDERDRSERAVEAFRQRTVDGFIVASAHLQDPLVERLRSTRTTTPFVLVARRAADDDLPFVGADDRRGVALALDHLTGLGHRRIVHIAGPSTASTARRVTIAFADAIRARGLSEVPDQVTSARSFSIDAGRDAMLRRLHQGADFSAVLAANDLIAIGCLDAMREAGLSCPHDVSVVGFNDMAFTDRIHPALTTVAIPFHEIGATAARLLVEQMDLGTTPPDPVVLPTSLVVRASTGPPPPRR